ARQRGQQVECMAGRWTFQLATVRVEEAAPHLRIVDPCLLNRPQQAGAWRDDREPDVEIVISLPAAPRHASRRIARRPDAQAFPAPGLVADTESTDVRTTHVTQRTTQSRRRVEFLIRRVVFEPRAPSADTGGLILWAAPSRWRPRGYAWRLGGC